MRTGFAVALCFVLGACATFGGGGQDIYGIYEMVPGPDGITGWYELKVDGTWDMEMSVPDLPEPMTYSGVFSVGEEKDGCLWIESWVPDAPDAAGEKTPISFCDGVMTVPSYENATFHKRR